MSLLREIVYKNAQKEAENVSLHCELMVKVHILKEKHGIVLTHAD